MNTTINAQSIPFRPIPVAATAPSSTTGEAAGQGDRYVPSEPQSSHDLYSPRSLAAAGQNTTPSDRRPPNDSPDKPPGGGDSRNTGGQGRTDKPPSGDLRNTGGNGRG